MLSLKAKLQSTRVDDYRGGPNALSFYQYECNHMLWAKYLDEQAEIYLENLPDPEIQRRKYERAQDRALRSYRLQQEAVDKKIPEFSRGDQVRFIYKEESSNFRPQTGTVIEVCAWGYNSCNIEYRVGPHKTSDGPYTGWNTIRACGPNDLIHFEPQSTED